MHDWVDLMMKQDHMSSKILITFMVISPACLGGRLFYIPKYNTMQVGPVNNVPQSLMDTLNGIIFHLRYRHGYSTKINDSIQMVEIVSDNGQRKYEINLPNSSCSISLVITQMNGNRIVFNGMVYTIDHFLLIDQLTNSI